MECQSETQMSLLFFSVHPVLPCDAIVLQAYKATYSFFLVVKTDALEGDYIVCLSVLSLVYDTVCA